MKPVETREFMNFRSSSPYIDEKTEEGFSCTVCAYMGIVTVTVWSYDYESSEKRNIHTSH